jgi:micrococcal nuclease
MSIYRNGRFEATKTKKRYTMRKLFRGFLILLIVLILALPLQAKDSVTALSIVDGDTLRINYQGREESIRLIGIDAPESRPNKKAEKDAQRSGEDLKTILAMGKKSTGYVKTLVKPGDKMSIEFDVQTRDKYGRLLGYVYLSNGKMLNEEIVKAGYANVMTVPPNVKHQERFLRAYREARENGRGLWGK